LDHKDEALSQDVGLLAGHDTRWQDMTLGWQGMQGWGFQSRHMAASGTSHLDTGQSRGRRSLFSFWQGTAKQPARPMVSPRL